MKKFIFGIMGVVAMLATSCEKSYDGDAAATDGTAKVSVNLEFPQMFTRAYSDGTTATRLQYAVFENNNGTLSRIEMYTETNDEIKISKQLDFQLVTNHTYTFVFWAAAEEAPYEVAFGDNTATMAYKNETLYANDEKLDAFFANVEKKITGDVEMSVILTRPFAQINVGTSDFEIAETLGAAPDQSAMTVQSAYKGLNLLNGEVTGDAAPVVFEFAPIPGTGSVEKEDFPVPGYDYLAMAYVLQKTESEVTDVKFSYKNSETGSATTRTVGSVPVQRNFRTNMFGQVLTSNASLNIIIVPEYEEPDHNYSQLLFAAAVGGTAVLDDDVEIQGELTFTKDAIIDLGGHEVNATGGNYGDALVFGNGANVVIRNGTLNPSATASEAKSSATVLVKSSAETHLTLENVTVKGKPYAVYFNNSNEASTITIKSGTFSTESTTDNGPAVYVQKGGKVLIEGGTFGTPGVTNKFLLNIQDQFRAPTTNRMPVDIIEVRGGTFINFDPANNTAEGPNTNFVAKGYKSVCTQEGNDKVYIVVPADTDIIEVPATMNQEDFNNAISEAADTAIFYLGNGVELSLPKDVLTNKNFTFVGDGAGKSIINSLNYETATGSSLTFENLTLQVAKGGSATSLGFSGAENIALKGVTVKGEFHTFTAKTALFEGCTFNFDDVNTTDRQGVWCDAYGTTVFKDCVFQVVPPAQNGNETKAILIYSDTNSVMGDVEVTNCQFKAGLKSAKAAVEIHSEKMTSAGTVTITGCEWDENTYEGGLWREIYNVTANGHTKGDKTSFYTVYVDGQKESNN